MNIMNKLYKCALGLLTTFVLTCCFSSALYIPSSSWNGNANDTPFDDYLLYRRELVSYNGLTTINISNEYDFICMRVGTQGSNCQFSLNNSNFYSFADTSLNCLNTHTFYVKGSNCNFSAYFFKETDTVMPLPMTSLECQTNYNLIPISEVTANYCKLNFDLIDPAECPINEGTGAVNWSSLFINGTQYPGNASISVYIPEYIGYSVTYNDDENLIDIEGYNADESYIEGVINNEKLTPSNEDITLLFTGLVNFIPYLFIGLLIIRAVKIFSRIWR